MNETKIRDYIGADVCYCSADFDKFPVCIVSADGLFKANNVYQTWHYDAYLDEWHRFFDVRFVGGGGFLPIGFDFDFADGYNLRYIQIETDTEFVHVFFAYNKDAAFDGEELDGYTLDAEKHALTKTCKVLCKVNLRGVVDFELLNGDGSSVLGV